MEKGSTMTRIYSTELRDSFICTFDPDFETHADVGYVQQGVVFIIDGSMTVQFGDSMPITYRAGDSYVFPANDSYYAHTVEGCALVVTFQPPFMRAS